ncbi:GNAT family N-acetyltransferase [Macrococcus sp. DPC7161]|uniref:GNAT family N-acetyltransferase n=1 Tax=Macrococcus sp. DPC7161 TaxID=2507060 RepID=UPI00100BE1EB|nr:GNAT family N-acetyltransferase [Macrococcus sp. DPC7161]RXK17976.1 N-acetyltransferase [Macrococcus sp. DPC7161]
MLNIKPVHNGNEVALSHYELPIKQMIFSGHPRYIITRKKENYYPYVIELDNEVIGVFALEVGGILTQFQFDPKGIYLRGLSISYHHQQKGYFKDIIQLIEQEIQKRFNDKENLYLTVNVRNNAYFAFIKSGFIDEKRTIKQGISHLKVMKKHLS